MRTSLKLLVLPGLLLLAGCQSLGSWSANDDRGALIDDPWSGEVGTVARTEHPIEKVQDPLGIRNIFSSEKARQIERNVGVGD